MGTRANPPTVVAAGLGLKRWLLLLIAGLILIALGVAALPRLLDFSAWWRLWSAPLRGCPRSVLYHRRHPGRLAIVNLNRELLSAFRRAAG